MMIAHPLLRRTSALLALIACLTIASASRDASAGVAWHESYQAAQTACHSSQRPVLVIFTASWCEACQHLDSRLWANPEAAALLGACYEPVLVDVDANPQLARRMGISHIPSACVIDGNDRLCTTFDLPPTASAFVARAAQALQATANSTITPATTIAAAAPQAVPPAAAAVPTQPQPAAAVPATAEGRYADQGSRFAQPATPQLAPTAPPQAPSAFAAQPAVPATAAPAETRPWLAASQPATPAAAAAVPAQPQAPQQAYSAYPQAPPAAPAVASPQGTLASSMPPQTATPYPTPPSAVDSAAMATDRSEEEKQEKPSNSFLNTLQKPFAFMMPKDEPEDDADADLANAPTPYPVGLDGYCPVTLAEQASWTEGRAQWGVQHRGRTYLFAGADEQQRFLANPDRYAPALSGDDAVLAFEGGKQIPGQRRYGVTYQARIYLFSSLDTRSRFAANPQAYASRVRLAENRGAADAALLR